MSSAKQVRTRRYGHPGGVKSEAGKTRVRLNALSHGLFSKEVLLPREDGRKLAEMRRQYLVEFQPDGELETLLVDRIISSAWRLRRAIRIEKTGTRKGGDYRYNSWQNYMRYETFLERQMFKALHELTYLKSFRLPQPSAGTDSAGEDDLPGMGAASSELHDFFLKNNALIYDQS